MSNARSRARLWDGETHHPGGCPRTLKALRERLKGGGTVDMFDIGGCGCMVDEGVAPRDEKPE